MRDCTDARDLSHATHAYHRALNHLCKKPSKVPKVVLLYPDEDI